MRKIAIITQTSLAMAAGLFLTACSSTHEKNTASYSSGAAVSESSGAQANYSSSQASMSQSTSQNEVVIPLQEEQLNVSKRSVPAGQVTIRKVVTTQTVSQPVELRRERLIIERPGQAPQTFGESSASTSSADTSSSNANLSSNNANLSSNNANASGSADTSANASTSNASPGVAANADQSGVSAQANVGSAGASVNAQPSDQKSASASTSIQEPSGAAASTQTSTSNNGTSSSGATSGQFQEQSYTIQLFEEQPVVEKTIINKGNFVARKQSDIQSQQVSQQVRREDVQVDKGTGNVEYRGESSGAQISQPAAATTTTYETKSTRMRHHAKTITGDNNTLDEINRGNNTRGGAEDLTDFDEKANASHGVVEPSGAVIEAPKADVNVTVP